MIIIRKVQLSSCLSKIIWKVTDDMLIRDHQVGSKLVTQQIHIRINKNACLLEG